MTFSRRRFLGSLAPATLAPFWSGCGAERDETHLSALSATSGGETSIELEPWAPPAAMGSPFRHGVASGDPLADAVILWTRVTRETGAGGAADAIEVEWRLALDPAMREVVSSGTLNADTATDHTIHVDATGLSSNTTYYYQFRALERTSRVGRTKTLPDGPTPHMRLAVASCANYPAGYFNAYGSIARADVDLVVHLGDYIYEYANGILGDGTAIDRLPDPPHEILTLADYRRRHAQYKTDPDLQELHRQHPMVSVWDDHEIANDAYRDGAQNHQSSEGDYASRKRAAEQAYREWMPMRSAGEAPIYKALSCGDLLDLVMLDARLAGRDVQGRPCDVELFEQPERQILGAAQEEWLDARLLASQERGARWRLIGQQVIFAPLLRSPSGCVHDPDMWDGYPVSRRRVLEALDALQIDNVIVLTGDAHASYAIDVASDPFSSAYDPVTGRGSRLVEFVAPGVSSPGRREDAERLLLEHPHVKFTDQSRQGYILLDVTHERVQAEWYFVSTVLSRSPSTELGAVFDTRPGAPHLAPVGSASSARASVPESAP